VHLCTLYIGYLRICLGLAFTFTSHPITRFQRNALRLFLGCHTHNGKRRKYHGAVAFLFRRWGSVISSSHSQDGISRHFMIYHLALHLPFDGRIAERFIFESLYGFYTAMGMILGKSGVVQAGPDTLPLFLLPDPLMHWIVCEA